ncbi:MAG: flagellar motor switch protein FliG [Oscillospiraceae bacterium]|nr:flagellar motor switch protein FliG [Oscillospiraceae bacterium]
MARPASSKKEDKEEKKQEKNEKQEKPKNKSAEKKAETVPETVQAAEEEVEQEKEKMTAIRKVAAFIVAIGQQTASEIYKHLSDEEVEKISIEISRIDSLSQDSIREIMDEFYELFIAQKVVAEGGQEYSLSVLMNAFGKEKAKMLMERIQSANRAFEFLRDVDYKSILTTLQNELPQTIALVLSHINSKKSAQIIAELPEDVQIEVFKRIADLDSTSQQVIRGVEEMIHEKLSSVSSVGEVEFGGVNYLADVMNNLDTRTEKSIMEELDVSDPELVEEIRKKMFTFDDIVFLDNREIQTFLRECDQKDLTVALKGAGAEVKDVIMSNMSQRQQETIRTDLQYLHNVRMRDVEDAQRAIIDTIRRLEEAGEIVMSKGGMDEIIP